MLHLHYTKEFNNFLLIFFLDYWNIYACYILLLLYHMYSYKTFIYSFLFYSIYQSTLIRESTLDRKFNYLVNCVKLIIICRWHIPMLFYKYFFRMIYNFKTA